MNLALPGINASGHKIAVAEAYPAVAAAAAAAAKATPKSPAKTMLQKAASLTRKAGAWLKKKGQALHNRVLGGRVMEGQGGVPYGVVNRTRFGKGVNALKNWFRATTKKFSKKAQNAHNYVLGGRKVLKGSIPRKALGRMVDRIMNVRARPGSATKRSRFGRGLKSFMNMFKRKKQNVHNIAPAVSAAAKKRLENFLSNQPASG